METFIVLAFLIGYSAIIFEHNIHINKAASALLAGVVCWTIFILFSGDKEIVSEALGHHLSELAGILFFLLGAMTIVELIDAHDGFQVITSRISTSGKRPLLWIISLLAFFLSAVLDNLTTAIVMVSLTRKLVPDPKDRLMFVGMIVIAANAGGAWSPIGDVTTTMLWIGGQITTVNIIKELILPSLVCMLVPLITATYMVKGNIGAMSAEKPTVKTLPSTPTERNVVFFTGLGSLIFVPIFKTVTHLPPYMGILFGLGVLWVVTEIIHHEKDEEDKDFLSVTHALRKIDVPSILFFLGILLAVGSLQSTGVLDAASRFLDENVGNKDAIVILIGLLSAVIDNVPLVAAAMGMYDLSVYPTDHHLWEFIAYCAGTGGSILIIGSAAGVAAMGLEKISFFDYLKRIGWLAALGYFAGAAVYIATVS